MARRQPVTPVPTDLDLDGDGPEAECDPVPGEQQGLLRRHPVYRGGPQGHQVSVVPDGAGQGALIGRGGAGQRDRAAAVLEERVVQTPPLLLTEVWQVLKQRQRRG